MASTTITEDTSFSMKAGISSRRGDGIHHAEGKGAHHHADGPLENAALAQQHLSHEQGGQGNGHHAGA